MLAWSYDEMIIWSHDHMIMRSYDDVHLLTEIWSSVFTVQSSSLPTSGGETSLMSSATASWIWGSKPALSPMKSFLSFEKCLMSCSIRWYLLASIRYEASYLVRNTMLGQVPSFRGFLEAASSIFQGASFQDHSKAVFGRLLGGGMTLTLPKMI